MKKLGMFAFLVSGILLVSTGCAGGEEEAWKEAREVLGISEVGGTVISDEDSHGGFHGDGTSLLTVAFSDTSFLEAVESSEEWKVLPVDQTVQALLYGVSWEDGQIGPYLTDEEGNALIPAVQEGYYWLKDRQTSEEADGLALLDRPSINCTVAVYDTKTNELYYATLDT